MTTDLIMQANVTQTALSRTTTTTTTKTNYMVAANGKSTRALAYLR